MKNPPSKTLPLFGDKASDWVCPLCNYAPTTPLIACPECGCHILLTIKIRRLHDTLAQQGEKQAALAILHPQPHTP